MNISPQWLALAGFSTLALVAAGCSSSGGSSAGSNAGGSGQTVSVQTVSGAKVLVDGSGRSLYFSDQEKAAHKILCTSGACHTIWMPVTVPAGQHPTGPGDVMSRLTVLSGPSGRQVAYNGAPLYTFRFDHSAGDLNGDHQKDSFDGTNFTWEAATTSGQVASGSSSSNPYGGGGGY